MTIIEFRKEMNSTKSYLDIMKVRNILERTLPFTPKNEIDNINDCVKKIKICNKIILKRIAG